MDKFIELENGNSINCNNVKTIRYSEESNAIEIISASDEKEIFISENKLRGCLKLEHEDTLKRQYNGSTAPIFKKILKIINKQLESDITVISPEKVLKMAIINFPY